MTDTPEVDTSKVACAVACMIVSNPGGGPRPHAWEKRVNDVIRALRDERDDLRRQLNKAIDDLSHADFCASGGYRAPEHQ